MRYNWFRITCSRCGMDREFPINSNDRINLAIELATVFHDRKRNNFSGCKYGREITIAIVEKDCEING